MSKPFRCEWSGLPTERRFYIPYVNDFTKGTHTFLNMNCAVSWIDANRGKWKSGLADKYMASVLAAARQLGYEKVPPAPPLELLQSDGRDAWLAAHEEIVAPDELSHTRPTLKRARTKEVSMEVANKAMIEGMVPVQMRPHPYTVVVVDKGRRQPPIQVNSLDECMRSLGIDYRPPVCAQLESDGGITIFPLFTFDPQYLALATLRVHVTNNRV